MLRLRVLRTPAGAAPEHVRRAWVGLELPLLARERDHTVQSVLEKRPIVSRLQWLWGRVTGRLQKQRGFPVPVLDALAELERLRPLEASWWRTNAPHLCVPGSVFVFDTECGEAIDS